MKRSDGAQAIRIKTFEKRTGSAIDKRYQAVGKLPAE